MDCAKNGSDHEKSGAVVSITHYTAVHTTVLWKRKGGHQLLGLFYELKEKLNRTDYYC